MQKRFLACGCIKAGSGLDVASLVLLSVARSPWSGAFTHESLGDSLQVRMKHTG